MQVSTLAAARDEVTEEETLPTADCKTIQEPTLSALGHVTTRKETRRLPAADCVTLRESALLETGEAMMQEAAMPAAGVAKMQVALPAAGVTTTRDGTLPAADCEAMQVVSLPVFATGVAATRESDEVSCAEGTKHVRRDASAGGTDRALPGGDRQFTQSGATDTSAASSNAVPRTAGGATMPDTANIVLSAAAGARLRDAAETVATL